MVIQQSNLQCDIFFLKQVYLPTFVCICVHLLVLKYLRKSVTFTIKRFNHFCVKQKLNQVIKNRQNQIQPIYQPFMKKIISPMIIRNLFLISCFSVILTTTRSQDKSCLLYTSDAADE